MTDGPRLPLEILPLILDQLQWRVRDLHACSLTSKTWNHYATPRLYARLFLRDQTRLIKVFKTVDENATLARLVKVLEIRVFPFGLKAESLERLEASLLNFLVNATNLEELYWTRTGSLTDRVLPFLPHLPSIRTLELSGSSRFYSPSNITKHLVAHQKTPNLRHFSILLPDRQVCDELPRWARELGSKLKSFSVLCQHSTFVTDGILMDVSQHLTGLTRLSVAGAKQVTCYGISSLLKSGSVQELAIENLAIHPSTFLQLSHQLQNLQSLSLTYPKPAFCPAAEFWQNLANFVEDLPMLTEFTHYRSSWNNAPTKGEDMAEEDLDELDGIQESPEQQDQSNVDSHRSERQDPTSRDEHSNIREPWLSNLFLRRLLLSRGHSLRKLRIHGIVATTEQIRLICSSCPNLQDLVVHLFEKDTVSHVYVARKDTTGRD